MSQYKVIIKEEAQEDLKSTVKMELAAMLTTSLAYKEKGHIVPGFF